MASLVGQALSQSRLAKKSDAPLSVPAAVFGSESEFLRPGGAIVSSAARRQQSGREPARIESPVSPPVAALQTATAAVRKPDPPIPEPTVSSAESSTETVEPPLRISEAPSPAAPASAKSSTERRAQTRTLVDSLVYVSLGEENGGILLDVNDAGFSIQQRTATL